MAFAHGTTIVPGQPNGNWRRRFMSETTTPLTHDEQLTLNEGTPAAALAPA